MDYSERPEKYDGADSFNFRAGWINIPGQPPAFGSEGKTIVHCCMSVENMFFLSASGTYFCQETYRCLHSMKIGAKIKELRIQKSLTQEELADRCELSKGFISQLERDLTSPSIATLVDILQCLGTNLEEFFSQTAPEHP